MRFSTCKMSISDSIRNSRCSKRSITLSISSTFCFSSSLSVRCAEMVSARRPGSLIVASEVRISGGIFLFSLTYWSNWVMTVRIKASASLSSWSVCSTSTPNAIKQSSVSTKSETRTRCRPSTSTLTVPSGNLSICSTVASVPISYRSSAAGSSLLADFWATSKIFLSPSEARSSALTDLVRPTNSGITKCG